MSDIGATLRGIVLDIGCADQKIRKYLRADVQYIGLDYYGTATLWYQTRPSVFGNAAFLPISGQSVDSILLMDVLEHLSRPELCLSEIHRALKPGGELIIQVPFIYPIHDAPLDFGRWTIFGLRQIVTGHGFEVIAEATLGQPLETAALLVNIAICKTALDWIRHKSPLAILVLAVPFAVASINLLAWAFSLLAMKDDMMPHGYRLICRSV